MAMVSVDGAELFYSTRGTGPVCLVPTAVGTKPYERQMPTQLSDGRQLVFVDLRGGGQSTGDPARLTFDQVADDFEAIRRDLGVARVAVIGHSILGVLALEYGRRCPDTVSHVITVGTPPRGDMAALGAAAAQFFEQDASEDRKGVWRENMARFPPGTPFEQTFPAQAPLRFYDARTEMMPLYQDSVIRPELLGHLLGPLTKGWDVACDPGSQQVPVLLTHGRYDYTVPHTMWDGLDGLLPIATRHLFERSGHQPFLEEPDEFARVLTEWMKP